MYDEDKKLYDTVVCDENSNTAEMRRTTLTGHITKQ